VTEITQIVRSAPGEKLIYQIAAQPLDDNYLLNLEAAGVDGLVHLIWFPGVPTVVEEKHRLMEVFARDWIN
jgi:hypothetical protein